MLRQRITSAELPVYWRPEAAVFALSNDEKLVGQRRVSTELPVHDGWLENWPTIPLSVGPTARSNPPIYIRSFIE